MERSCPLATLSVSFKYKKEHTSTPRGLPRAERDLSFLRYIFLIFFFAVSSRHKKTQHDEETHRLLLPGRRGDDQALGVLAPVPGLVVTEIPTPQ